MKSKAVSNLLIFLVVVVAAFGLIVGIQLLATGRVGCVMMKSAPFQGVEVLRVPYENRNIVYFKGVAARDIFGNDFTAKVLVPIGEVSVIVSPVDKKFTSVTYWPSVPSHIVTGESPSPIINASRAVILVPNQSDKERWQDWLEREGRVLSQEKLPRRILPD